MSGAHNAGSSSSERSGIVGSIERNDIESEAKQASGTGFSLHEADNTPLSSLPGFLPDSMVPPYGAALRGWLGAGWEFRGALWR